LISFAPGFWRLRDLLHAWRQSAFPLLSLLPPPVRLLLLELPFALSLRSRVPRQLGLSLLATTTIPSRLCKGSPLCACPLHFPATPDCPIVEPPLACFLDFFFPCLSSSRFLCFLNVFSFFRSSARRLANSRSCSRSDIHSRSRWLRSSRSCRRQTSNSFIHFRRSSSSFLHWRSCAANSLCRALWALRHWALLLSLLPELLPLLLLLQLLWLLRLL